MCHQKDWKFHGHLYCPQDGLDFKYLQSLIWSGLKGE